MRTLPLLTGALFLVAGELPIKAADAAWNVNADGLWNNASNWNPAAAPGSTAATTNLDTATFASIITAAHAVTVDANRNLLNINFAANSSAYTLSGGNLLLSNGGSIQTSGAGAAHTDVISSAIELEGVGGAYSFTGGSSVATRILSISGGVTGVSTAGNTTTLTLNGTTTGVNAVSGIIGDGAAGGRLAIVKSGTGNWTLSGANSFTGSTTILSGTLTASNAAAFGAGISSVKTILIGDVGAGSAGLTSTVALANTNEITVQSGSTAVTLTQSAAGSNIRNSAVINLGSAGSTGHGVTLTTGTALNGFNGKIQDPTGLIGVGGVVTVNLPTGNTVYFGNTVSTYTGGTIINGGTGNMSVETGTGTQFGSGPVTINGGGFNQIGVATVNGFSSLILNNALTLANNLALTLNSTSVDLGATGAATTRVITNNSTASLLALGGAIANGSNGTTTGITKTGTGILALSGASTYTGATVVSAGTVRILNADDRLPVGTTVDLAGQTAAGGAFGTLDLNNRNQTVAGLTNGGISGTGTSYGTVTNGAATNGASVLTVTGSSTFAGVIQNGTATRTVGLTKSTGGVLTLTGANTYTGATTVTGGTLLVNGSLVAGSAVAVNSGGTLGGSGVIGGAVTVNSGGTLAPGNSPGLLTLGSLDLNAGATTAFEINGNTRGSLYDAIDIAPGGATDLDGALTLSFGNLSAFSNADVLSLMGFSTPSTGDLGSLTSTGFYSGTWGKTGEVWSLLSGGQTLSFSETTGNLTFAAVPEPTTYALIGMGALVLVVGRRRRTRRMG